MTIIDIQFIVGRTFGKQLQKDFFTHIRDFKNEVTAYLTVQKTKQKIRNDHTLN